MINFDFTNKKDKDLQQYIDNILNHKIPLNIIHSETPASRIISIFKSQEEKNQIRIKKVIFGILKNYFNKYSNTKLTEDLDTYLANLSFLCESLKIRKAYIFLRILLDRGTLSSTEYFFSKDTERKVLRSLIAIKPSKLLNETIWHLYWKDPNHIFWDVAFLGMRKSDFKLAVESLQDAITRWEENDKHFDLPQAIFDLLNQNINDMHLTKICELLLIHCSTQTKDVLKQKLTKKGINENTLEKILPENVFDVLPTINFHIKNKKWECTDILKNIMQSIGQFNIYYHADMDGVGSCVLFMMLLHKKYGIKKEEFKLFPVDHNMQWKWSKDPLDQPSAVLDFLYHKKALFWFDHHINPFATEDDKKHYKRRERCEFLRHDPEASSCISMLFSKWKVFYQKQFTRNYKTIEEMVKQIDKIDTANYRTVDEWYNCEFAASKIDLVMLHYKYKNDDFCNKLVSDIYEHSYKEVIKNPEFLTQYKHARADMEYSFAQSKDFLEKRGNIVFYDSTKTEKIKFYRFFPYKFNPTAKYTVGIYEKKDKFEVSVGRNPWSLSRREINIGRLCDAFGGGGHPDIGGITNKSYKDALNMSEKILKALA